MIIYRLMNIETRKIFTKVFESEYEAYKFRKKVFYSRKIILLRVIEDL